MKEIFLKVNISIDYFIKKLYVVVEYLGLLMKFGIIVKVLRL